VIFSDGMENSRTVSFYRALRDPQYLDKSNWADLQQQITKDDNNCPDLSAAQVTWYMPPFEGRHFRQVRRFWEDTLRNVCKAGRAEVIY
jgi:hypothetical protein